MKIACIGNSHLASLKNGWDRISANNPGLALTFFGARNMALADLRVDGGTLVAGTPELAASLRFTSGGLDRIDPNDHDAIVLYGMWLKAFFYDESAVYSRKAIERAMHEAAGHSLSLHVLKCLNGITDKPIFVGHDPLPTAQNATRRRGGIREYLSGIDKIETEIFKPLGARIVRQPAQTMTPQAYTDPRFKSGAARLAVGDVWDGEPQPARDIFDHMNAEFGALWLDALFQDLTALG